MSYETGGVVPGGTCWPQHVFWKWNKRGHTLWFLIFASLSAPIRGGDTNFTSTFNANWRSGNADQVLSYVDGYLLTNQNAEALFARGVVAAGLQSWGRGATNYLSRAIISLNSSTNYSEEQKAELTNEIYSIQAMFTGLLLDTGEPINSSPSWNTNNQASIFSELGDEAPYFDILNRIANPR
jgi:hypothetical protein